jgi:hypothetical protein
MSDEVEKIWKEEAMFNLKVLSLNSQLGAEEYHYERE